MFAEVFAEVFADSLWKLTGKAAEAARKAVTRGLSKLCNANSCGVLGLPKSPSFGVESHSSSKSPLAPDEQQYFLGFSSRSLRLCPFDSPKLRFVVPFWAPAATR